MSAPLRAGAAAAVVVAAAVSAGCGAGAERVSPSTSLGDAVLALSLNPAEQEFAAGVNAGYVVLVNADGTFREVRTAGMDQGAVGYADGELYFMDVDNGYFTGRGGTTVVPAATTNQIDALLRVSDGYVGVYNEGGGGGGGPYYEDYLYQVLRTTRTPPQARLEQVGGFYSAAAACGDEVYGVAVDVGETRELAVLKQISPVERLVEEVRFPTAVWLNGTEVPCRDGAMYFVGSPYDVSVLLPPQQMQLYIWDVAGGGLETVDLTGPDGGPLLLSGDEAGFSRSDAGSLAGGTFHWVDGKGRILATDIATGVTAVVAQTGYSGQFDQGVQFSFEHPGVMLGVQKKEVDDPVVLTRWDLATGAPTEILRVAGVETSLARILRDFVYWGDQAPCAPQAC